MMPWSEYRKTSDLIQNTHILEYWTGGCLMQHNSIAEISYMVASCNTIVLHGAATCLYISVVFYVDVLFFHGVSQIVPLKHSCSYRRCRVLLYRIGHISVTVCHLISINLA